VAATLVGGLLLSGCVPQQQYDAVLTENQQLKAQLALSQQQYDAVVTENQQLKAQFAPSQLPPEPVKPKELLPPPPIARPTAGRVLEAAGERKRLIPVLFATNRKIDGPAVGTLGLQQITDNRSPSLAYEINIIRVPEFHKIGEVERPYDFRVFGLSIWKTAESEKKHFVSKYIEGITKEEFLSLLRNDRDHGAMVFVHGFDNSFSDAIFKTAQIAYDTSFPGVPVTFAWPSKGEITAYDYDRESAVFSRDAFLALLRTMHDDAGLSKIYVIAHSMGNQIVVDALAHAEDAGLSISVSELVLAAPDVDRDVFRGMIDRLKKATKGLTLYASSADKALAVSRVKAAASLELATSRRMGR
jgi:esterase/lipase superfamily enzyme/outer membrane murein-binding lipoprotein Lpp